MIIDMYFYIPKYVYIILSYAMKYTTIRAQNFEWYIITLK